MLSRFLSLSFIFLSSFLTQSFAVNSNHVSAQCDLVFSDRFRTYRQPALEDLHIKSVEAQVKSGWKAPTFVTPAQEFALYETRKGIVGPTFVQKSLVPGDKLIPSSLVGANERGVVKTSNGLMVHVLGNIDNKNFVMGVSNYALVANESRSEKFYDSEDSMDVILWDHGGGTETTGHHTGVGPMGYFRSFKVDVIAIDLPWHSQGLRDDFAAAKELLDFLEKIRHKYVSKGKRVWLAGHSMGGAIALLYQQIYGEKTDVFAGIMALSPVVDVLPGANLKQKNQEYERLEAINRKNTEIPEGERSLGEALARQGKISPVCGLYCDLLIYSLDFNEAMKPEKKIPMMILIGKGDGLYQGSEKQFERYAQHPSKNIQLHVLGKRRFLTDKEGGAVANAGHLVFDNKPYIRMDQDLSDAALAWLDYVPAISKAAVKAATDYRKKFKDGSISRKELSRDFKKQIIAGRVTPDYLTKMRDQGVISWDPIFSAEDLFEIETFVLMRKFMSKVSGHELVKHVKTSGPDASLHIRYSYMNNLVFRQFASGFIYTHVRPTELGASLGKKLENTKKFQMALHNDLKGSRTVTETEILPFVSTFIDHLESLQSVEKFMNQTQMVGKATMIHEWNRLITHMTQFVQNPKTSSLLVNLDILRRMLDLSHWSAQNMSLASNPLLWTELQNQIQSILEFEKTPQALDRRNLISFLYESISAYSRSIESILKGLDVPSGENGSKVAALLKEVESYQLELRSQRKNRSELKLSLQNERQKQDRVEAMLMSLKSWVRSEVLKDLYDQNENAFQKLMDTDKRIRARNTELLDSRFNGREFVGGSYKSLPSDLVAEYELYAKQKQEYRHISSEYEQALLTELSKGHAKLKRLRGHEYVDLLNSIHRRFAEELIDQRAGVRIDESFNDEDLKSKDKIYVPDSEEVRMDIRGRLEHRIVELGREWHSNGVVIQALTNEMAELDRYLAEIQTRIFHLDAEIYKLRGGKYFTHEYYTFMSLLNMPPEWYEKEENRAEINNLFQKLWKEWQEMWGDRPIESKDDLY